MGAFLSMEGSSIKCKNRIRFLDLYLKSHLLSQEDLNWIPWTNYLVNWNEYVFGSLDDFADDPTLCDKSTRCLSEHFKLKNPNNSMFICNLPPSIVSKINVSMQM